MRTIAVVTGARADYGILRPVMKAIAAADDLRLRVLVTGAHLAPAFGRTVQDIDADGFDSSERIEMLLAGDTPAAVATSAGLGVVGFAQRFAMDTPDVLLLTGDRFEMLAAAVAALPFTIPLAHLHGGEVSEGAIDEQIRHAISKMSHLHFASTRTAASRLLRLGEEAWRITVTGAPALDNLHDVPRLTREELERRLGIALTPAPLVVTFHPATLEPGATGDQVQALLGALESVDAPLVVTYPNADTAHGTILDSLRAFVDRRRNAVLVPSLGTAAYFSLLRIAAAMVGNSSSGILEAPTFELPVVNIGDRQAGRDRAPNVVDVSAERRAIVQGLALALSPAFRERLRGLESPYGDGHAAPRIVEVLRRVRLDGALLRKPFQSATVAG